MDKKYGWARIGQKVEFKQHNMNDSLEVVSVETVKGVIENIDGAYIMVRVNRLGYLAEKYLGELKLIQ